MARGKGFRATLRAVNAIVLMFALVASLMVVPAAAQTSEDPGQTDEPAQPETEAPSSPAPSPSPESSPSPTASPAEPAEAEQVEQTSDPAEEEAAGGAESQSVDLSDPSKMPEHVKQRRAELAQQIRDLKLDEKWVKGKEIPELRTAHSKTFMGDEPGQFDDKLYPAPIHFSEGDRWEEIDSNLGTAVDGRRRSGPNSFGLSIANQATDGKLVQLDLGEGKSVGFSLEGARSAKATVKDNKAVFAGVADNTDLHLSSFAGGLKEDIVLHSLDSPRTFVFPLELSGLTASINEQGDVLYADETGKVLASTPHGFMYDSADPSTGQVPALSDGVTYELIPHAVGVALQVSADTTWIEDQARNWPITIDPTIGAFPDDTFVAENFVPYDFSAWPYLYVGRYQQPEASYKYRSFIHFNTTSLWGKKITTAGLRAYEYYSHVCSVAPGEVYPIFEQWQGSGIEWPGPDIQTQYQSLGSWFATTCNERIARWDVTDSAQIWATTGAGNGSYALRASSESSFSYFKIYDSSQGRAGKAPYMLISWSSEGHPFGSLGTVEQSQIGVGAGPAGLRVSGWLLDPDLKSTPVPALIEIMPDGSPTPVHSGTYMADFPRPDVANNYPGYGENHGLEEDEVPVPGPGSYDVCVTGINIGSQGADTQLYPCSDVEVVNYPDVPQNVSATRQAPTDPVHVTWDPPVSNGGAAITLYRIQAKTEDGTVALSHTCAAGCSAADLPGLGEVDDYSFEVSAQNAQGYGPAGVFTPPASTDATGLEDFWPYSSFDLGHGVAYPNMASGNLVVQDTDFDVPGQGLNLRLTRTYNSNRSDQAGPFGRGFTLGVAEGDGAGGLLQAAGTLNLGQVLTLLFGGDSAFRFIDADGTVHRFVKQGGVWQSPPGVNLTVEEGLLGFGYSLVRPDGVRYHFADAGDGGYNLASITDRAGNALQFSYDGLDNNLTEITDGAGRKLTFVYGGANGQISRISFVAGTEALHTDYVYGGAADDRLVAVTRAAGTPDAVVTEYGYNADGLDYVEDGRDNRTSFSAPAGLLQSITDRAGKVWQFDYAGDPGCQPHGAPATQATCLTDPEGHTGIWSSNDQDNLMFRRDAGDADGSGSARLNTESFDWADNRITSQTDQAGNTTTYSYDANTGVINATAQTGVDGSSFSTQMNYDPALSATGIAELDSAVTAAGTPEARTFSFEHDAEGLLTSAKSPEQTQATAYAYHPGTSLLQSVTDAEGNVTLYGSYHPSGQPGTITDAEGNPGQMSYDFLGRMTQSTDREGQVWKTAFDLRGNLVRTEDPEGSVATFCYDANNNQTVAAPPRATGAACTLDGTDGHSVKTAYDERDMVKTVLTKSDGKVSKSTYSYFDDGQLQGIQEPRSFDPADGSATAVDQSVNYTRYPNNRVSAFVDELGHTTDVIYTPHGLIEKVTDPPGDAGRHSVTYAYNRLGQVTSALESGHTQPATFAYNLHGDLISQTTPKGSATAIAVDGMGRPSTVTDAEGNVTAYSYDQVGNLTSLTQPTGDNQHTITSYAYTALNQLDHESDPADAAHFIDYLYDKQGRQILRHDRRDDPVTGAIERTVQQAFHPDGTLKERIATGTGLEEHKASFGYDADNNMTSVATYSGGSATPNVSELAATYTSAGQLKDWSETIYPPGGGNPVTMTGSYDWAQDGLKTQSTIDSQSSTTTWLLNGREDTFTPYGGFGSFSSTYFQNGALQQMSFPDGQVLTHGYDAADRLSDRVLAFSAVKLSAWEAIGYDEDDHRLSEQVTQLQPSGPKTGASAYGYDNLGRLDSFKHAFEALPTGYTLDDAGNITAEGTKLFTYENNRLKLRTELVGVFEYGYDLFGNQITETELGKAPKTTEYNAASHTKKVTEPDGKWVEYRYDGLERLVSRLDSEAKVTLFFRDGLSEQIALETDAQGGVTTRYLTDAYSVPRGKIDIGNSTGRSYYMTDPRGNVTQMLERSTQDVTAAFNYGPYGEDKGSDTVGNWDSRLKFQMAPKDPMTGSYTIGPRVMDPGINRFVGADMYVGAAANLGLQMDPLTGNRYLYAGANPIGFIDDGHRCQKISSFWTWGNCEDDTNAFVSGSRHAVAFVNDASGWVATGASFITVVCPACAPVSVPVAVAAGWINLSTGASTWIDECWFRRQDCYGASAGFALSVSTRRLGDAFENSALREQAPELLRQIQFGLNTANTVGTVASDDSVRVARPHANSMVTFVSHEQVMRQATDRSFRQLKVREAGREKLRRVRAE